MLSFYTNSNSIPAMRVRFFLEEAKIPFTAIEVDLAKGEQHQPKYLNQYAMAKVPSIKLGDFQLGESGAIIKYLAAKFSIDRLYPTNLESRAQIDMWVDYTSQHIGRYIGELAWHRKLASMFKASTNIAIEANAEKFLLKYLPHLENHLCGRNFMVGHDITVADIAFFPSLKLCTIANFSLCDYPNLLAYSAIIGNRESWKKVEASVKRN